MSYLEQLRAEGEKKKKAGGGVLPKLTEPGFVGFVGEGVPPVGFLTAERPARRTYAPSSRKLLEAAHSAPLLPAFREALALGSLCICANCKHFSFGEDLSGAGLCGLHGEAFPFVPFNCPQFALSGRPSVPYYSTRSALLLELP